MNICFKERVRELNPIKEVVGEIIQLKGNTGSCPKHNDRHPSFSVNPEKGICQCWAGCTNGSLDVFGFYQWYFGCTFLEAMEKLAKRAGIVIETSGREHHRKDPWEEMKDLAVRCRISYRRWMRCELEEKAFIQAQWSQKQRKRAYEQYEWKIITKYALERRLLALEREDGEFDELYRKGASRDRR